MQQLKTFIVEDSRVIRNNLIAALEELTPGIVVGTAEDERAAIGWLADQKNECDLVIIDIFLKSGSGLRVLEAATAMPRSLCLVVLSNYATQDMRTKCTAMGAARVFDKSQQIEDLFAFCSNDLH